MIVSKFMELYNQHQNNFSTFWSSQKDPLYWFAANPHFQSQLQATACVFSFWGFSYKQNHTISSLLCLTSFTGVILTS